MKTPFCGPVSRPEPSFSDHRTGSVVVMGDNGEMEVTPQERQRLEEALAELEALDPSELPDPASRLAGLLESLLEPDEEEA